ncbi:hypothetical protein FXO38_03668 [Capsicum annuum]|nr:hypothetical protein FXO38_03668 [Capsicum annuum]
MASLFRAENELDLHQIRNYGSYKYESSMANVTYLDDPTEEALIKADTISARGNHDLNTTMLIDSDGFSKNPNFLGDLFSGCLNCTS